LTLDRIFNGNESPLGLVVAPSIVDDGDLDDKFLQIELPQVAFQVYAIGRRK
jgi:hypothetical protein